MAGASVERPTSLRGTQLTAVSATAHAVEAIRSRAAGGSPTPDRPPGSTRPSMRQTTADKMSTRTPVSGSTRSSEPRRGARSAASERLGAVSGGHHRGHDDRRLARLARAGRRRAVCSTPCAAPRRPGSTRRCRRTTSRRGASGRASPGSRGRGWARRWPRRRCRSASSTPRASGTTRRSSPRPRPRSPRCSRDRLWVALGTGEYSNEHITGQPWPDKATRTRRLEECVAVMRALFAGEEVTHHGLVTVDRARLWTLPAAPPALIARRGLAGDGRLGGRLGRRPDHRGPGPGRAPRAWSTRSARAAATASRVYLQVHVSWAPTDDEALAIAFDQWRTNVFDPPLCWDLAHVEHFDEAARHVAPDDVAARVIVSSDPAPPPRPARRARRDRLRRDLAPPRRAPSRSGSSTSSASTSSAAAAPRHAVTAARGATCPGAPRRVAAG